MKFRLRHLSLAIALLGTLTVVSTAKALTYEWISPITGNWSDSPNWLDGMVPPAGGVPEATLVFDSNSGTGYTSSNNLGGAFSLNQLVLDNNGQGFATVRNTSGSGLSFTGANAVINVTGIGTHNISDASGGLGISLDTDLAINMGLGSLNISSVISGSHALTINGTEAAYGAGALTLSGNNTFSGGLTLQSGNLILSGSNASATPVGSGTFTINGGYLSSGNTLTRLNGPVTLNSDLRFNTGTITFNGPITVGNASVGLMNSGGNINLNTALDIQGATVLGGSPNYYPAVGPATLTLGGNTTTFGTLLHTSAISLLDGATLNVDNSSSSTGNLADRVSDTAAIAMESATISFRAAATGSSETLGSVGVAGYSTLEARPGTSQAGTLTLTSLNRVDHGVLLVRGQSLGDNTVANHGTILVTGGGPALVGGGGAAGSTTVSIVPWAVGNYSTTSSTGTANSFATYDAVHGFRALNPATEFATTLGTDPTQNVQINASIENDGAAAVNSLLIGPNTVNITGNGSIAVASGAVLYAGGGTATMNNSISFGAAEGVFTTDSSINVTGNLTGSGGLTKNGAFNLVLSGDNSGLTGPLTINGYPSSSGSRVDVTSAASLPGSGAITVYSINSSPAGLGVNGNFEISRDIVAASGQVGLTTLNSTSSALFSGTISGPGSLNINSTGSFGTVELTGNNTYTGSTRLNQGFLIIHSDANLGNGGALLLGTNTGSYGISLAGDWTTSRQVDMLNPTGIYTGTHSAVLNGIVTGNGNISKLGTGTLTFNGNSPYAGIIAASQGSVYANGTISAKATVASGATFGGSGHLADVNVSAGGVLDPGSAPLAVGTFGSVTLELAGGSAVAFDLGANSDLISVDNALTETNAGTPVNFQFNLGTGVQAGNSYDLITFRSTTFAATDFSYTGPNGLSGTFELSGNSLRFDVNAVPEPASTALLVAGLGILAGVAVRRRR